MLFSDAWIVAYICTCLLGVAIHIVSEDLRSLRSDRTQQIERTK
jgi:hypothetical protein